MTVHSFYTTGAVGSPNGVAPSRSQIDTASTCTGTVSGANSIFLTQLKNVRLLKIVVAKIPSSADAITLNDGQGSPTNYISITVPTSGVGFYDFGPLGIPIPAPYVTTTQASGAYIFIVDADGSIA